MRFLTVLSLAAVVAVGTAIYSVKDASGNYCILLDANISGTVTYFDDVVNATQHYDFAVNGSSVSSHGKCLFTYQNESAQSISLEFFPNDITPDPAVAHERWLLKIIFTEKNNPSGQGTFRIADFSLDAHFYDHYFNASEKTINYTLTKSAELEWSGENNNGYSCSTAGLSLTNDSSVQFKNLKVLAFAKASKPEFAPSQTFEQCQLDVRTSDLVPIVVGACLAGLVIIVLIAYLIGRARARRQGYASV